MDKPTLIKKLHEVFPALNPVCASQFYGRNSQSIWCRGAEDGLTEDGGALFDVYSHVDTFGVHPDLADLLSSAGWFVEAGRADDGTLMICQQ